jgi:DNA-binding beta-propeller fold protein YncE
VAAEPGDANGLGASVDGADKGVARLNAPTALAFDKNGALLVADSGNHKIRKLVFDAAGRATVSTLAGSTSGDSDNADPLQAQLKSPGGLAVDLSNNDVYVADTGNQKIKRISANSGAIHVIAGSGGMGNTNGAGTSATFTFPRGLVLDNGKLYVTDTESNMVRLIDVAGANDVSTFVGAGGTIAPNPGPTFPFALTIGADKALYLAEQGSSTVRKIKDGAVTLLAGTSGSTGYADGAAASAKFDFFTSGAGLAVGADGTVYVADSGNVVIRAIKDGQVSTFAGARVFSDEASHVGLPPGDGPAKDAKFNAPIALAVGADGALYVADQFNNCIRRIK